MAKEDTYTLYEFQKDFPDNEACLELIMALRYGDKPKCQECKRTTKYHRITGRRAYVCQFCGAHVYPCIGTPFEKSRTDLHKWFYAMYLFTTTRHGVPAKELQRQLGVTYKCAWRMGHEIRKLMSQDDKGGLFGECEVDETYIGGRRQGKRGRGAEGKSVVVGIKERGGPVKSVRVSDAKKNTIEPFIRENVRPGTTINTDEWLAYKRLGNLSYTHDVVNHGKKEWVRGKSHTNSIEGYWSILKRSIRGTHVHVSKKYLQNYLHEFDFRHNNRTTPQLMFLRLVSLMTRKIA